MTNEEMAEEDEDETELLESEMKYLRELFKLRLAHGYPTESLCRTIDDLQRVIAEMKEEDSDD